MFLVAVNLILLVSKTISQQVPSGCDVTTTTGYRYSNFHHLHSNPDGSMKLRFRVMAKSDAHVALTTSPLVLNPLYEIVIGASGNNYTDLRRTMTGRSVSAVKTPMLLSDSEYRGFWISVNQGSIEVGREGETLPYFHWKDSDPLPVHYYSLSSWTNTVAKWIQNCNFDGPNSWLSTDNSTSTDDSAALTPSREAYNVEEKLKQALLQSYNREVRPSSYHNIPVTVALDFSLIHFDLTEVLMRFDVTGWLHMTWRDPRLQWNASDYENISMIAFPSHSIWQPDLKLYNGAIASEQIHIGDAISFVYFDGSITTSPGASFDTLCNLDLRYWPFDSQTCKIKLASWAYNGYGIDLSLTNGNNRSTVANVNMEEFFTSNLQWQLINASAEIQVVYYSDIPYPSVTYTFEIRRRSPLYQATTVVPAIVIAILTLVAFFLPPSATEKITIGMINVIILIFSLIYFSNAHPPLGDRIPVIIIYYSNTLVMSTVLVMIAVGTITVNRTPKVQGIHYMLKNILVGSVGKLLGLEYLIKLVRAAENRDSESTQHQRMDEYNLHVDAEHDSTSITVLDRKKTINGLEGMNLVDLEWLLLSYAVDRLAFVFYLLTFIFMSFLYL